MTTRSGFSCAYVRGSSRIRSKERFTPSQELCGGQNNLNLEHFLQSSRAFPYSSQTDKFGVQKFKLTDVSHFHLIARCVHLWKKKALSSKVEKENTLYVSETRYVTIHLAAIYGNLSSESGHASAITENIAGKKNNLSVHSQSAKGTSTAVLFRMVVASKYNRPL